MQTDQTKSYTPSEAYNALGLNQGNLGESPADLYLDMVKRAVCNFLYEDTAIWRYDHRKEIHTLNRYDLEARFLGEDLPTEAHTMIGWRRLCNIQTCADAILKQSVPGDFVETGVLRGGSAIFMRALLKAHGSLDRQVIACDTFVHEGQPTDLFSRLLTWGICRLIQAALFIPSQAWRKMLFRCFEGMQKSFPKSANPSEAWIDTFLYGAAHWDRLAVLTNRDRTSLEAVKSNFARYGLLDNQVVFLKGFFSETLPSFGLQKIALLRCDGDSFESTYGVLQELYSKVSPGGFIIIDDYHSYNDCKEAVDRFRTENGVVTPLSPIDNLSVYWQK